MRHAMPSSFLFLAVISLGTSVEVVQVDSSDKVRITAGGAFVSGAKAAQVTRSEQKQKQSPDDSPFEIAMPNVQAAATGPNAFHISKSEGGTLAASGTPFEVDPNYMPFVVDDGKSRPPAAEVQAKEASVVNDSPFLLDSETSTPEPEGPRGRHGEKLPIYNSESTFVIESEADDEEDRQEQEKNAKAKKQMDSGTFTIVRSGKSSPGQRPDTTTVVMNMRMESESTSPQPTTSTEFKFELGDSLLEISPGQKFVPIPDTPFEAHPHVALSIANQAKRGKRVIELIRPGVELPPAVLSQSELKIVPAVPHLTQRMMRNAELQDPINTLPADSSLQASLILSDDSVTTTMESSSTLKPTEKQLNEQEKPDSASAGVASPPIHSQNAVDTPGTRPSVQLPPSDSSGNNTMSTPGSISNITVSDVADNSTNGTVHSEKARKFVSTRGAIASIILGLIITIFFLSVLTTILNAGRKEEELSAAAEKEPPRATTTYRQSLIAQQQPEVVASTGSPPNA